MKIDVLILIIVFVSVVLGSASLFILGHSSLAIAIDIAYAAGIVYSLIGFWTVFRSFHKPSAVFYRAFFTGLAIRFVLFLVTLIYIYKFTEISIAVFGISFVLFFVLFQGLEIHILWQKLERQKSK